MRKLLSAVLARLPGGYTARDLQMLHGFFRMMLRERVMGSSLGMIWAVANPLLMLGIFTFVFGFVFKSRLPGAESSLSFVIWLISGYGPWLAIAEAFSASTGAVVGNGSLVKNLTFKTELLPIAAGLTGIVPLLVAVVYLVCLLALDGRGPSMSWFMVPVYLALLFSFVIGLGMMLAAVNVFVRDVSMALPSVLTMLMFGSPIFYPLASFPTAVQNVMRFNPFYVLSEGFRQPLLFDQMPPLWATSYMVVVSGVTFAVGLLVFRRCHRYFDAYL
jgi:lipopolysaccharide transport system permease protein